MKNVHVENYEIKGQEWEKILDNTFKKRVKNITVDGFRKGKCPKSIYLQKYGVESLFMDAIDEAGSIAFKSVLKSSELNPVVEPKMVIKEIDKDHVLFEFTIITRPEVKLGKYKDLGVKKDKVKVSEEEIEQEIARLTSRFAEIVIKEDGEVVEGNTAVIDFEGTIDGKILDGGMGKNYPLEIGSHTFIPGFEEGLVGMKVGEEKELNLKFPEDYTKELANKEVTFKVTVREIKERVLPELNEDFYADLGYENIKTEEEFKAEIKKALEERKEEDIQNKYIDEVLEAAIKNLEVEINEEIIDEEVSRMIDNFVEQLKMQGLKLEQYFEFSHTTEEDLRNNMRDEAIKYIKCRYLIEEVAEKEKVEVTEEEAQEETQKYADSYGITKEEFLAHYGGIEVIKYDIKMHKALEILGK